MRADIMGTAMPVPEVTVQPGEQVSTDAAGAGAVAGTAGGILGNTMRG